MTLTYIWHDCFVVSTSQTVMIFDFWKDPLQGEDKYPGFINEEDKEKHFYVFVSHHHKDHFTKDIFDWVAIVPNIHFILSKDTAKFARHILSETSTYSGIKPKNNQVTVLSPGDRYEDSYISVEAFGSTDIGNSYMVGADGERYFHAGDLNAWIWKDESTVKEVAEAEKEFLTILMSISKKYPGIEYAMFPVDSRIGSDFFRGAYLFVREINVNHFFPMHFGLGDTTESQEKYRMDACRISNYANQDRGEYICLTTPYSRFSAPRRSKNTGKE